MRVKNKQRPWNVVLTYESGNDGELREKVVVVKASDRETAIRRARKRNPNAVEVECP